jgi:hypothetical protein
MPARKKEPKAAQEDKFKRAYVSQADIPKRSLREALTVAQAITDNFAGTATAPHRVAMALGVSPTSSGWRDLSGSTVAYGLTKGAYNSDKIALEPLGKRALLQRSKETTQGHERRQH